MKMYPKLSLAFCSFIFISFIGCATKTVSVTEEKEFMLMTQRLGQVLHAQEILDAEGQFIEPIIPIAQTFYLPDDLGLQLYKRLAPNFYVESLDSTQHVSIYPTSFAEMKSKGSTVRFSSYGFVLTQKKDTISVVLLASTDWNGDKDDDYIILARIISNTTKARHDYYLVVEDINAPLLTGRVIGTYDYKTKKTKSYGNTKASAFETNTIEVEAGSRPIVLPRDSTIKAKDKSETSLSE